MPSLPEPTRGSQAVGRARAVLACFQDSPALSVTAVSRRLGLTPPTAHRLLRALVEAELVAQDPASNRYHLGPGLAAAGALASRRLGYEAARPELHRLADALGFSVTLGVNHGLYSLIVETALPDADDAVPVMPGIRAPVYACAMGKSIWAYADAGPDYANGTLEGFTRNTILSPSRLRTELEQVRFQGWALNDEELNVGIRGVAAPIRGSDGSAFAAVAAPTPRLTDDALERAAEAVLASAARLRAVLSRPAPPRSPPPRRDRPAHGDGAEALRGPGRRCPGPRRHRRHDTVGGSARRRCLRVAPTVRVRIGVAGPRACLGGLSTRRSTCGPAGPSLGASCRSVRAARLSSAPRAARRASAGFVVVGQVDVVRSRERRAVRGDVRQPRPIRWPSRWGCLPRAAPLGLHGQRPHHRGLGVRFGVGLRGHWPGSGPEERTETAP